MNRLVGYAAWAVLLSRLSVGLVTGEEPRTEVLGFEGGKPGTAPGDWFVPVPGWKAEITEEDAAEGKQSAKLWLTGESQAPFGNLMRSIDATSYRGQQVKLTAKIRIEPTENKDARAQMWLRVDRVAQRTGFFDNMGDRPLKSTKWTSVSIEGDVATDAQQIALGLMSFGGATVFVDDVALVSTGAARVQLGSPPRATTAQGLQNLRAAVQLCAYVRFFHPSDESLALDDWNRFTISVLEAAEPAEGPADLAQRLQKAIDPLAPTMSVWAGSPEQAPPELKIPEQATSARFWVHHGAGMVATRPGIYASNTNTMPLSDEVRKSGDLATAIAKFSEAGKVPVPNQPSLVKQLAPGVCCRLPLLVFMDEDGSLPKGTVDPASETDQLRLTSLHRGTRLAGVALCWGVMQHFYPYFDDVATDWDAALSDAMAKAAVDASEKDYEHTLQILVGKLHDGHGRVLRTRNVDVRRWPLYLQWVGNDLVIAGKHPAAPPRIGVGDVIVSINGEPLEHYFAELSPRVSAATDGWHKRILAGLLAANFVDVEPCPLRLRKPDGSEYEVDLSSGIFAPLTPALEQPAAGEQIAPGIVYLDLNALQTADLNAVLDKLESAQGIVFDLRGYPGDGAVQLITHLIDKPVTSAQWNVPVVTLPDGRGWSFRQSSWNLRPAQPRLTAKIAFLTGSGAISYAESIMGIVEHYKLGEIVGGRTAGTNGNVNPFEVPADFRVMWTGMKVLKHDGTSHHGIGIMPTVPVRPTIAGIADGQDEVLEKAVEVLLRSTQ